jgi:hypothetical protein
MIELTKGTILELNGPEISRLLADNKTKEKTKGMVVGTNENNELIVKVLSGPAKNQTIILKYGKLKETDYNNISKSIFEKLKEKNKSFKNKDKSKKDISKFMRVLV